MNPPRSAFGASPLSQHGTLLVLGHRQRPGKAGSAAAAPAASRATAST
jgi:hypothetical protein